MKRTLKGHVYDSDAAREIGRATSGDAWDSASAMPPGAVAERLLRTKSGLYFLHGAGGSSTRYARGGKDGWEPGEAILPLDPQGAERWARENLPAEAWEAEFGEANGERQITVSVPAAVYQTIRNEAATSGRSMGAVIAEKFPNGKEA